MPGILLYIALAAFVLEVLTYFVLPRAFSMLALLPAGSKRHVKLPVPVLERLTAHLETNERGQVQRDLDLTRVDWPKAVKTKTAVGKASAKNTWVRVRQSGWQPQGWAVARIVAKAQKDEVVLRVRFVPVPFISLLLLLASLGLYVATDEAAVPAAFLAGLCIGVWGSATLAVGATVRSATAPVLALMETTLTGGTSVHGLPPKSP